MGTNSDDRFDWNSGECVVLPTRMGIAIYHNPKGDVVIRQEDQYDMSQDAWIVMSPADSVRVARHILDMAAAADGRATGIALYEGGEELDTDVSVPAGRTAAERQRRRRAKLRDTDGVTVPVTANDRDTHSSPQFQQAAE